MDDRPDRGHPMKRHTFLERFSPSGARAPRDRAVQAAMDAAKTESFEAGYTSGWDDAIASDKAARQHLEAEFQRNVQGLALTFGDAVAHVRSELRAFVEAITDRFIPAVAPECLSAHVRAELLDIGDDLVDAPLEIVVSPDCISKISEMVKGEFSSDITVVKDETLSSGQVFVRIGEKETEFDLDPLISAMHRQLTAIRPKPNPEEDP